MGSFLISTKFLPFWQSQNFKIFVYFHDFQFELNSNFLKERWNPSVNSYYINYMQKIWNEAWPRRTNLTNYYKQASLKAVPLYTTPLNKFKYWAVICFYEWSFLFVPSKSLPPLPAGSDFFATPLLKVFLCLEENTPNVRINRLKNDSSNN